MDETAFSLWEKNIEYRISKSEKTVRNLIANFSLAYNVNCFNFLMKTPERVAVGGNFNPHDLFINSLLVKEELKYDISKNVIYGKYEQPKIINLGIDPVFAYPWGEERMSDCLLKIGEDNDKFQMSTNHGGILVLPYDICFVTGGNHSIMAGIFKKDGYIEVNTYCDYKKIINDIGFNGEYYYLKRNKNKKVAVKNDLLGLIFSLGKYLI